ncbi:hypothetical protein C4X99_15335 [Leptospira interrogans serovar Geyaweera]|nr:hypothetical protein C4X99_15335 [Leptospira interrogans serovar Geyaweera]QCO38122.1 hypothetical protein E4412_13675 [Leptospira interrogans]
MNANIRIFVGTTMFYNELIKMIVIRQNGAPSGLENRGLDARFAFTTKQENRQKERNEKKSICRNGCPQRNDSNCIFNE